MTDRCSGTNPCTNNRRLATARNNNDRTNPKEGKKDELSIAIILSEEDRGREAGLPYLSFFVLSGTEKKKRV